MLPASIGVLQNRMNMQRHIRQRIRMTSRLVSRPPRPGRQRMRLQAMPVVTLIIPPPQRPHMEAHIPAIRLHPHLPLLGHNQRIRILLLTSSPVDGIIPRSRPILLTQCRPQIRTGDKRHPQRLNTLLQGILVTMTNPFWSIAKPP